MSIKHCCDSMNRTLSENDSTLIFEAKFREYGILINDGGSSFLEINFCPWCGIKLPTSLRDNWFGQLEALGIDPFENDIPEAYLSSRWYETSKKP